MREIRKLIMGEIHPKRLGPAYGAQGGTESAQMRIPMSGHDSYPASE